MNINKIVYYIQYIKYYLHMLQLHWCSKEIWHILVLNSFKDVIDLRSSVSLFHMFAEVYLEEWRLYVVVLTYGITSFLDPRKVAFNICHLKKTTYVLRHRFKRNCLKNCFISIASSRYGIGLRIANDKRTRAGRLSIVLYWSYPVWIRKGSERINNVWFPQVDKITKMETFWCVIWVRSVRPPLPYRDL